MYHVVSDEGKIDYISSFAAKALSSLPLHEIIKIACSIKYRHTPLFEMLNKSYSKANEIFKFGFNPNKITYAIKMVYKK